MVSRVKRYLLLISVAALVVMVSFSFAFASTSKVNSKTYTHPSFYKGSLYKLFHGVDVSYWQHSIDWSKSKAAGIDFAIMRCGYTALNKFALHQDSTFLTNYNNATKAGVSVGIYYYACATTAKEAKKEANYVISILKNNNVNNQLPVVMDYEIDSGRANTTYKSIVNKKGKSAARKRFTNNAVTFMNTIRAAGYEPMFYSYRVMIDPNFSKNYRFNMKDINGSSQYRFWLAQYSTSISYTGNMEIWQFTSTGRVDGMNGNIDRNFWYYPLNGTKTKDGTKSIRKCTVTLSHTMYKYTGKPKRPKVTVKYGSNELVEGTDYSVSYMRNIKKGTASVLVHGKGGYSNETYSTFVIGDKNDSADKTTVLDPSALTPTAVNNVKTSVDIENNKLVVNWDKAKHATKYQIAYKINEQAKWSKKYVEGTKYELTQLEPGSTIELKIRAANTDSEDVIYGEYSDAQYRFIGSTDNKNSLGDNREVTISWDPYKDDRGTMTYVVRATSIVGGKERNYTTDKNNITRKLSANHSYQIRVIPLLTIGKKTFTGSAPDYSKVYVSYSEIKSKKALKGGFQIEWTKIKGKGTPRYKILVADNKEMKDFQYMTKAQKITSVKIEHLERKKVYYVAVRPYNKINNIVYYGKMSKPVKIKTK